MPFSPEPLRGTGILRLTSHIEDVDECVVLVKPLTTVGRHPSSDIPLPRNTVSRFHARIIREKDRYIIEDLDSSNGTYINSEPIEREKLKNSDKVAFGDVEYTFYFDEEISTGGHSTTDSNVLVDREKDDTHTTVLHTQDVTDARSALAEIGKIKSVARASKYLSAHYRFLEIIRQRPGQERLLNSFLELLLDVVKAGRGAIMLETDRGAELQPAAALIRDSDDPNQEVRISKTILDQCVHERIAIVSRDIVSDKRFSKSESILNQNVRSALCVPLLIRQRLLGVCYLDSHSSRPLFDDSDLAFVANLTAQLSLAIDNLRMTRERIQAEQLVLIGQTMAEISHSIKNILSLTGSSVELMERHLKTRNFEKIQNTWSMVRHSMDRVNKLTADMLDYSRNEKHQLTEVDVNHIVLEVQKAMGPEMESLGIQLELTLDPDLKPCWLEPEALFDTLTNIAVNAVDALGQITGKGRIRIKTDMKNDTVAITVSDNGPGIPAEIGAKVFNPFFTTKGAQGNGMGLAMVQKYVHEMGGEIELESEPGNGAAFRIAFPASSPEDHAPPAGP